MSDEELKQEKYRCEIQGGLEGLEIADLFIKMGPIQKRVVLMQGEMLPVDLVEFDNLKKSRLAGALKRCIELNWISVQGGVESVKVEAPKVEKQAVREIAITESAAGIIRAEDVTNRISEMRRADPISAYPEEKQPLIKEVIDLAASRNPNAMAITEVHVAVASGDVFANFDRLKYFQKLKSIKDTSDMALLSAIISRSQYPQLVHNAEVRMQELNGILNGTKS